LDLFDSAHAWSLAPWIGVPGGQVEQAIALRAW
jgi:hypothetical protein